MAAERPLPWPPPTTTGHASTEDRILQTSTQISNQLSLIEEMLRLLVEHHRAVDADGIVDSDSEGDHLRVQADSDPETVTEPLDIAFKDDD